MKALLLLAVLTAGDGAVTLKTIKLQPPSGWAHTPDEGGEKFIAPSGEAYFHVNVDQTARKMGGDECVGKITKAIGGKFDKLTVGKSPAAKKIDVDKDETGKEFVTWTYVGCNGTTTWSLSFHAEAEKKNELVALVATVTQSIEYLAK
jgi:hypothetical protein